MKSSFHGSKSPKGFLKLLLFAFFGPLEFFCHYVDNLRQDYISCGFLVKERDGDASADHIVRLYSHLALNGEEHLTLDKGIILVEPGFTASDLADLDDSKASCAMLADQMLGDVSRHLLVKYEKVLILLVDFSRVQSELVTELLTTVGSNQVEVESLSLLVLKRIFESIGMVLENAVNCLLALGPERSPLASHETDEAAIGNLDDMVARNGRS